MNMQNTPNVPSGGETKEPVPTSPELASKVTGPEAEPIPVTPEKPAAEQFFDQPISTPNQPHGAGESKGDVNLATGDAVTDIPVQNIEDKPSKIDKVFVEAADKVIDDYEDRPYEEEEAHENLQIKYLWQRFKKKLTKSKD